MRFKIGDKVQMDSSVGGEKTGVLATVVQTNATPDWDYTICFDSNPGFGWELGPQMQWCWRVHERSIRKVHPQLLLFGRGDL